MCIRDRGEYGSINYVSFINFYFVRELFFEIGVYRELINKTNENEENIIYIYSLYIPFLKAIKRLKKTRKNIHCCLIIPDLPGSKGLLANARTLAGFRDRAEEKIKYKLSSIADSYVFLTEEMKNVFPKRPYTCLLYTSLGLDNIVDDIIITDALGGEQFRKPCDIAFRIMQRRWGIPFEQMMYVGDNLNKDFQAPKQLGMQWLSLIHISRNADYNNWY